MWKIENEKKKNDLIIQMIYQIHLICGKKRVKCLFSECWIYSILEPVSLRIILLIYKFHVIILVSFFLFFSIIVLLITKFNPLNYQVWKNGKKETKQTVSLVTHCKYRINAIFFLFYTFGWWSSSTFHESRFFFSVFTVVNNQN